MKQKGDENRNIEHGGIAEFAFQTQTTPNSST